MSLWNLNLWVQECRNQFSMQFWSEILLWEQFAVGQIPFNAFSMSTTRFISIDWTTEEVRHLLEPFPIESRSKWPANIKGNNRISCKETFLYSKYLIQFNGSARFDCQICSKLELSLKGMLAFRCEIIVKYLLDDLLMLKANCFEYSMYYLVALWLLRRIF